MEDITKFMAELESEVKAIKDKSKASEAKARLEKAMSVYSGEDELISSLDILERIKTQPEEEKFMTGISGLDEKLKGFRKNQLIVLAAPTKSGKTQMTVELAIRMPQLSPVFIPFEESAEELVRKFHDRNEVPPMFYTPKNITGNTVDWIEKKVVEGLVKFNSRLFFVDHLHFIVPFSSDRLDTRIGQTMRDLKKIAKDHEVIIVIVAHLKKTSLLTPPTLEDLRDSSFIAQEADTVLMMWREAMRNSEGELEITNRTIVSIQANRRTGTTGNIKMVYEDGRYREEDWKHEEKVKINGKEYVF